MLEDWLQTAYENQHPTYYPGSRHKIGQNPNLAPAPIWDDKPRIYKVHGEEVEFFTTGQLAKALNNRAAVTIRKWEQAGIIPKPKFKVPGRAGDVRGNRRLYTRAQVEGMIRIAYEEGLLRGDQKPISNTQFKERVLELFRRTS